MEKYYLLLKFQSVENIHYSCVSKQVYWNVAGDWALKEVKFWGFLVLALWNLHVGMITEIKTAEQWSNCNFFFKVDIFIWFTFQSSISHTFLPNNAVSLDNLDLWKSTQCHFFPEVVKQTDVGKLEGLVWSYWVLSVEVKIKNQEFLFSGFALQNATWPYFCFPTNIIKFSNISHVYVLINVEWGFDFFFLIFRLSVILPGTQWWYFVPHCESAPQVYQHSGNWPSRYVCIFVKRINITACNQGLANSW